MSANFRGLFVSNFRRRLCSSTTSTNSAKMSKRKTPSSENNPNHDFCEFLTELADYERNVNRNVYKYNAYRKAAGVLAAHPQRIVSGKEAKKLSGVGEKIAKKIDEFLSTGKLQKLENIQHDERAAALNLLTRVTGIGPAKAQSLVELGVKTVEDLQRNKHQLNHHQLIGLKYFEDFERKIPRTEIRETEDVIRREMALLDGDFKVTICGSYRRGKAESGDVDMLITHPSYVSVKTQEKKKKNKTQLLQNVVSCLEKCGLITETISLGETKFMGACRLRDGLPTRRLDIRLTPHDQYYCSVLYFTGSDLFNKEMRAHALDAGFTLNEYTLRPVGSTGIPGEPVEVSSERDIFDCIGYPYKEPEERSR